MKLCLWLLLNKSYVNNLLWLLDEYNIDAQRDFGKIFVTKKLLLSYILNLSAL